MNYFKLYDSLIRKRKSVKVIEGYSERHHIIPKSMGGTNNKNNIVKLTAREHFIAHRFLAKMYPKSGMVHAVYLMACTNKSEKKFKITSRTYERLRKNHSFRVSNDEVAKMKKSLASKGKKQSKDHVVARVKSRKENKEWHSEATKKKIGAANKGNYGFWRGKKINPEIIKRGVETRKRNGSYSWTEERKQEQSARLLAKNIKRAPITEKRREQLRAEKTQVIQCPYCNKKGAKLIMPRWHFNNCKYKPKEE